jgi:hypothetical protein
MNRNKRPAVESNRPLIESNKYLRDPEQRNKLIVRCVLTSSAVEGIHVDPSIFLSDDDVIKKSS